MITFNLNEDYLTADCTETDQVYSIPMVLLEDFLVDARLNLADLEVPQSRTQRLHFALAFYSD